MSTDFKEKYLNLYNSGRLGVADIFDSIMSEIGIPITFKKIAAIIKNTGKEKIPQKMRFAVIERDKATCQLCGRTSPAVVIHVDHIIPISRGGLTEENNLRVLCSDCNFGKSDRVNILKQVGEA